MNNHVIFEGNVGNEPELRQTPKGTIVATYSIAVFRNKNAETGEVLTDWFNIVAWGEQANMVKANIKKGSKIHVEGRLQTRKYKDKENKEHYVTELMQDSFWLAPQKEKQADVTPVTEDDLPF